MNKEFDYLLKTTLQSLEQSICDHYVEKAINNLKKAHGINLIHVYYIVIVLKQKMVASGTFTAKEIGLIENLVNEFETQ